MITRNIKNVLDCIGLVSIAICTSATPHMVKYYLTFYIIFLISLWLSEEQHNDEP